MWGDHDDAGGSRRWQLPPERTSRGPDGSTHAIKASMRTTQARRVIVHTSQLARRTDEGFTAFLCTPARDVVGVRLVSARVPRLIAPMARPAHLVLFSVPTKNATSIDNAVLHAVQRRQLLSTTASTVDTYDFPTPVSVPWPTSTTEPNIGTEPDDVNVRITLHTLSVDVQAEATMSQIGHAFRDALKHHTGISFDKTNSLWNYFIVNPTPTGFAVALDPDARQNTLTYGDFYGPFESVSDSGGNTVVEGNTSPYLKPFNSRNGVMGTRILLSLSRPVFVVDNLGVRRRFMPSPASADAAQQSTFVILIPSGLSFTTFSVPEEVTLDRIIGVEEQDGSGYSARSVSLVRDAYTQAFEVQMRLVVDGRTQGVDYEIDASIKNEFADHAAAMHARDLAIATNTGDDVAAALSAIRRPNDLDATALWYRDTTSTLPSLPHQRNDLHQMSDVLFSGHMMNVSEPAARVPALSTTARASGGGWRVAVPPEGSTTRFIAPAYPHRPSRGATTVAGAFDVSPLVARILNDETSADGFVDIDNSASGDRSFYRRTEDAETGLVTYVPRVSSTGFSRAVVVMMDHVVYRIVSARRVSHFASTAAFGYHAGGGASIVPGAPDLVTMDVTKGEFPPETRYWSWVFELDRDVSLPSFIHPEDRERRKPYGAHEVRRLNYATAYSNGGSAAEHPIVLGEPLSADVVRRVFEGGIGNAAAMFVPNEYHVEYGRPAPSSVQIAPPTFVVRDLAVRAPATQSPYLTLRGIGNAEIARGAESDGVSPRDILCVLNEEDRGDRVVLGGSETRWMSTPLASLDRIVFDFVYADNTKYPVDDTGAVLVFDIYASGG